MRKVISILAALALIGSAAAAPKKAPAKPAAKPAVAAPVVPTAPAVPKSSAPTGGAKFIVTPWGGYSINAKTDLYTAADSYGSATETTANNFSGKTSDNKNMGVAGGLDLWYGEKFQFGVGAYYLQGFKVSKVGTYGAGNTIVSSTEMNYIPVVAQIRFFVVEGLYAGLGGGVALVNGGKSSTAVTGSLVGSTGFPYTDNYTGTAIWLQGRVGYVLNLTDMIGLDISGIFSYQISTVSYKTVNSSGTLLAGTDTKNSGLNITPALGISLKF